MNMHNSNLSIVSTDNASATRNSLLFYLQIMQVLQDHYDIPSNTVAISSFILSCRYLDHCSTLHQQTSRWGSASFRHASHSIREHSLGQAWSPVFNH